MKQKFLSFIVLMLMILSTIGIVEGTKTTQFTSGDDDYPTLTITINSITKLDPIDLDDGAPEWYYIITVKNVSGGGIGPHFWQIKEFHLDDEDYTNIHTFNAYVTECEIDILLKEDDGLLPDDIADISKEPNKDKDPMLPLQDEEGRKLKVRYNIIDNILVDDGGSEKEEVDQDDEFPRITNGEELGKGQYNDGNGNSSDGENQTSHLYEDDAEISFTIGDNYEPMTVTLAIENTNVLVGKNNNNIIPGTEVKFECNIAGGWPDFSYCLYPKCGTEYNCTDSTDSTEYTFRHTYDTFDRGKYRPCVGILDFCMLNDLKENGTLKKESITKEDYKLGDLGYDIFINQRPIAKLYKDGLTYKAMKESDPSYDPDGDSLEYNFEVNGEEEGWSFNHEYKASIGDTVRLKVRDRPLGGTFDDGLESNGWATNVKTKSKQMISTELVDFLLENLPILYHFLKSLTIEI